MPDCVDRFLDSADAVATETLGPFLHPAQSLVNAFKEPPTNYAAMQDMSKDITRIEHQYGPMAEENKLYSQQEHNLAQISERTCSRGKDLGFRMGEETFPDKAVGRH